MAAVAGLAISGGVPQSVEDALATEFGGAAGHYLSSAGLLYKILSDTDFTALTPQDWSGDTAGSGAAKTVNGLSATATRQTGATTWGISSAGLRLVGNCASACSLVFADLLTQWSRDAYPHLIAQFSGTFTTSANGANIRMDFPNDGTTNNRGVLHAHRNTNTQSYLWMGGSVGGSFTSSTVASQTAQLTSFRGEIEFYRGEMVMRGDLDAGYTLPDPRTLTAQYWRGQRATQGTTLPTAIFSPLGLGLYLFPNSVSVDMAVKRLRIFSVGV